MAKPLTEEELRKKVAQMLLNGEIDLDLDKNSEVCFYTGFYDDGNDHYTEEEPDLSEDDEDENDDEDEEEAD